MAAAVSPRPSGTFDVHASGAYPVRLGRDLPSCSSVQYNHKPSLSDPENAESMVAPASRGGRVTMSLKDGHDEYKYSGRQRQDEDTFVLLLDEEAKEFDLERLSSSYAFNLTRAPWESNSKTLAEHYPQIQAEADAEHGEGMFGDAEENDLSLVLEADTDNPFDFRQYLDKADSPSPTLPPAKPVSAATPAISQSSTRTNTPLARSSRKQASSAFAPQVSKPPPKARPKPKPVESRTQPKPAAQSPPPEPRRPREEIEVPSVRLDRRASTRVASNQIALPPQPAAKKQKPREPEELCLDDDNGDLILEGDEPPRSSYHGKSSLGLALANQLGEGPRSLRSAASSPAASYINSPAPRRPSPLGEDGHGDSDDDDLIMDQYEQVEQEAESDDDVDGDVDDLQLPSPAQAHRRSVSGQIVTGGDEDDDLEKQMLLELEGGLDDDGPSGMQGGDESDEESEEE